MRQGEAVFVDSGAWIALALTKDPFHEQARAHWDILRGAGAKWHTSIPVVMETFTFLERNATRDAALAWKDVVCKPGTAKLLPCDASDLEQSWAYFKRRELHKLSSVDATSFVIMKRNRIRTAFSFDHHFASAGFQLVA